VRFSARRSWTQSSCRSSCGAVLRRAKERALDENMRAHSMLLAIIARNRGTCSRPAPAANEERGRAFEPHPPRNSVGGEFFLYRHKQVAGEDWRLKAELERTRTGSGPNAFYAQLSQRTFRQRPCPDLLEGTQSVARSSFCVFLSLTPGPPPFSATDVVNNSFIPKLYPQ
jgi:hypothetical protein